VTPVLDNGLGFENMAFGLPPFKMRSAFKEHTIGKHGKGLFPQVRPALFLKQVRPEQVFQEKRRVPLAFTTMAASFLYPLAVFIFKPVIPEGSGILPPLEKVILANLNRHKPPPAEPIKGIPALPRTVDSLLTVLLSGLFLAFP
jgi:hypothetical protein